MSYEIELKAHITDPEAVVSRLTAAGFHAVKRVSKDDRYYRSENGEEFRLRLFDSGGQDGPRAAGAEVDRCTDAGPAASEAQGFRAGGIVTHKEKCIRDGVEYNVEREFTVDSPQAFESLCERIGAERFAVKQKHGWYLSRDGLTAEVVEVVSLGWFLEIEAVIDESADDEGSERAATSVREALSQAGVSTSAVESKTYLSMLGFRDTPPRQL